MFDLSDTWLVPTEFSLKTGAEKGGTLPLGEWAPHTGPTGRFLLAALTLWQTLAVSLGHLGFLSPSRRRWKQALGGNIKGSCNNDFGQVNPIGLLRKLGIDVIIKSYTHQLSFRLYAGFLFLVGFF